MNKEERTKRFKSLSSMQRQELILKKMKERGIEVGSGVPNKKSGVALSTKNVAIFLDLQTHLIMKLLLLYHSKKGRITLLV